MLNLVPCFNLNITFFAKKYKKFITRAGLWNEKSVEKYCKDNIQKLFTFYDLDAERYTTATGDITIVERKDN